LQSIGALARTCRMVTYRFNVGTRVLCRTDEWLAGTIIKLNYREPDWPRRETVPYQVQLDDGDLIFVPEDVEVLCKKLIEPWWVPILEKRSGRFVHTDVVEQFRKACMSKDVNERNHKGQSALLEAVRLNWAVGVETLIQMQADVNIVDDKKLSALHLACMRGMPVVVGILMKARANPNCQDNDPDHDPEFKSTTFGLRLQHRTPLHYCCLDGYLEIARLLLQGTADLNVQDAQFKAPVHLAIEEGHDAIIDLLLQSGAAVDLCTLESGMKNSPLMDAAHTGKHVLAEKLIRAGADVNKVGKQDMAALHLAARRGDSNMVKLLLEARADTTLESKCGTALNLAKKKGSAEVLQLFGVKAEDARQDMKRPRLDDALRAVLYMN